MKIATWNVNSVRARMINVANFINSYQPDVLLLQEIKCTDTDFPESELNFLGYNCLFHGQKSYNGVAILSKLRIDLELKNLPQYHITIPDEESRYLEATLNYKDKLIRLASVYVPNGNSELEKNEKLESSKRYIYKLNFFDRLQKRIKEIHREDECFFIGGDYNIAHTEMDLHDAKGCAKSVGFQPSERSAFDQILSQNFTDSFRQLNPKIQEYTWWDYRGGGWPKNKGWRLDYILASQSGMKIVKNCEIIKQTRAEEKASDHVPVMITLA